MEYIGHTGKAFAYDNDGDIALFDQRGRRVDNQDEPQTTMGFLRHCRPDPTIEPPDLDG